MFTEVQITFMKEQGITVDFSQKLTGSDFEQIEEKISLLLQKQGFDATYKLTKVGEICESILDVL